MPSSLFSWMHHIVIRGSAYTRGTNITIIATCNYFLALRERDGNQIPIGTNNLLLRGCIIRNTENVEGIVVYAGKRMPEDLSIGSKS